MPVVLSTRSAVSCGVRRSALREGKRLLVFSSSESLENPDPWVDVVELLTRECVEEGARGRGAAGVFAAAEACSAAAFGEVVAAAAARVKAERAVDCLNAGFS